MLEKHPYAEQFTKESFNQYFDDCLIVFDSSVLLNLYEFTIPTREQVINALKHSKINQKLWIPWTVVEEFLSNRERAIHSAVERLQSTYETIFGTNGIFYPRLPDSMEGGGNPNPINDVLTKEIDSKKALLWNDTLLFQLDEMFPTEKTGDPITGLRDAWIKEYSTRIKDGIPTPGEKDQRKAHNKEADYFIWCQLIEKAKSENKNIWFITRDKKDDWWSISNDNKIITEKISLLREFYEKTGKRIRIYDDEVFFETLSKYGVLEANEENLVVVLKKENQLLDNFDTTKKVNEMIRAKYFATSSLNEALKLVGPPFLPGVTGILNQALNQKKDYLKVFDPFSGLLGVTKEMEEASKRFTAETSSFANAVYESLDALEEQGRKVGESMESAKKYADDFKKLQTPPDIPKPDSITE